MATIQRVPRYLNSTMVRLKARGSHRRGSSAIYFNSTMVRLKAKDYIKINKVIEFQFHYGTIKSLTLEKISALIFKNLADTKL